MPRLYGPDVQINRDVDSIKLAVLTEASQNLQETIYTTLTNLCENYEKAEVSKTRAEELAAAVSLYDTPSVVVEKTIVVAKPGVDGQDSAETDRPGPAKCSIDDLDASEVTWSDLMNLAAKLAARDGDAVRANYERLLAMWREGDIRAATGRKRAISSIESLFTGATGDIGPWTGMYNVFADNEDVQAKAAVYLASQKTSVTFSSKIVDPIPFVRLIPLWWITNLLDVFTSHGSVITDGLYPISAAVEGKFYYTEKRVKVDPATSAFIGPSGRDEFRLTDSPLNRRTYAPDISYHLSEIGGLFGCMAVKKRIITDTEIFVHFAMARDMAVYEQEFLPDPTSFLEKNWPYVLNMVTIATKMLLANFSDTHFVEVAKNILGEESSRFLKVIKTTTIDDVTTTEEAEVPAAVFKVLMQFISPEKLFKPTGQKKTYQYIQPPSRKYASPIGVLLNYSDSAAGEITGTEKRLPANAFARNYQLMKNFYVVKMIYIAALQGAVTVLATSVDPINLRSDRYLERAVHYDPLIFLPTTEAFPGLLFGAVMGIDQDEEENLFETHGVYVNPKFYHRRPDRVGLVDVFGAYAGYLPTMAKPSEKTKPVRKFTWENRLALVQSNGYNILHVRAKFINVLAHGGDYDIKNLMGGMLVPFSVNYPRLYSQKRSAVDSTDSYYNLTPERLSAYDLSHTKFAELPVSWQVVVNWVIKKVPSDKNAYDVEDEFRALKGQGPMTQLMEVLMNRLHPRHEEASD